MTSSSEKFITTNAVLLTCAQIWPLKPAHFRPSLVLAASHRGHPEPPLARTVWSGSNRCGHEILQVHNKAPCSGRQYEIQLPLNYVIGVLRMLDIFNMTAVISDAVLPRFSVSSHLYQTLSIYLQAELYSIHRNL